MTESNLFDIDKSRLDWEWEMQPKHFHEAAIKSAEARQELERAKARLDVAEADAKLDIRRFPEKYNLEKLERVTEDVVKSAVLLHPKYQQAVGDVDNAKHVADMFAASVSAWDMRKRALENLVELLKLDYWAPPRTSGANKEMLDENGRHNTAQRVKQRLKK